MEGTKKLSQIFSKARNAKSSQYSNVEQQAGNALIEIVNSLEGDNKKIGSFIEIVKAI